MALDTASKPQTESDLINTLDLPSVSFEEAQRGLQLLSEWKSEESVRAEYKGKAAAKWSEAAVFKA